jgi:hypothetical protein
MINLILITCHSCVMFNIGVLCYKYVEKGSIDTTWILIDSISIVFTAAFLIIKLDKK